MTAIIPTTGRPELVRAVKSVIDQTAPVDIFVCLDAPDQFENVRQLLAALPVQLVLAGDRAGAAHARNVGVQASSTEYVAFLDDDDWWEPSKVERQLQLVDTLPKRSLIACLSWFHPRRGDARIVPARPFTGASGLANWALARTSLTAGREFMQASSMLLARSYALMFPWNEELELHEDWDFAIALVDLQGFRLSWVPEALSHVQQGSSGSLSLNTSRAAASLAWAASLDSLTSGRVRADFTMLHAVRPELRAKHFGAVTQYLLGLRSFPHAAAVVASLAP